MRRRGLGVRACLQEQLGRHRHVKYFQEPHCVPKICPGGSWTGQRWSAYQESVRVLGRLLPCTLCIQVYASDGIGGV